MVVRNLNGTSNNRCICDSWLDHWKNFSGQNVSVCVVNNCLNKANVGGHVQKVSPIHNNWYIIPLCIECNNKSNDILYISESVNLVSAKISETCGLK